MVLVGCDPSYKRTGLAMYKDGVIYIRNLKVESNADKSFQRVWEDAEEQSLAIVSMMLRTVGRVDQMLSECPPPQGTFSPGLYALDSLLFSKSKGYVNSLKVVYPNYVGHVHGKRKYQKSESVELALRILDKLKNNVKVDMQSKRISHDESEALIFLCRLFVINNMFKEELLEWIGLFSEKEKVLY